MGCESLALITRGYLCCRGEIVNRIVHPINISIKTRDFCLSLERPLNTQLFLSVVPNIKISPKLTTPKILIKKTENFKLNIRKCKE